jgi:acetoacetyl-CoA synthetase
MRRGSNRSKQVRVTESPLWIPGADRIERANLTRFSNWLEDRTGRGFSDYQKLWSWSVSNLEEFWASIWDHFAVRAARRYDEILSDHEMPGARWFTGARLNWAENVLADRAPEKIAALHCSERRPVAELTYGQLSRDVAAAAAALRSWGVGPGDRVAAYTPNIAETLVAALAAISVGAVWSSAAPEFGPRSVIDRFVQIEPTVLFAIDGYRYGGRDFDRSDQVSQVLSELPTVQHVVMVPYLDGEARAIAGSGAVTWDAFLDIAPDAELSFEAVPSDHPLWILFSSGTTGLPKPIIHSHGGMLLEQMKAHHLHLDLHDGDRVFWFTTTGWTMWNMLMGSLLTEAAVVMYDGNPVYPRPDTLWQLAADTGITTLGASAGFFMSQYKAGLAPGEDHDLSRLTAVGSTGAPLPPEGFEWIYSKVKSDLWLYSISGGSDVCAAFVGGCATLPVYAGEMQCRQLGVKVEAWNGQGQPVIDEVGELIVSEPMPSMPLGFWGDPDGSRYRSSYFEFFPGVWRHGDWIKITPRGGAEVLGRSDATINRNGVRMGTAEIYRAVTAVPAVLEALVVDVPRPEGELWMPLFVVLREGVTLTPELQAEICKRVREDCSPRHVPDDIMQIAETPKTLSGKILELPVKRILSGADPATVASRDSLANPDALDFFVELASHQEVPTS